MSWDDHEDIVTDGDLRNHIFRYMDKNPQDVYFFILPETFLERRWIRFDDFMKYFSRSLDPAKWELTYRQVPPEASLMEGPAYVIFLSRKPKKRKL